MFSRRIVASFPALSLLSRGSLRTFITVPPQLHELQTSGDMAIARRWAEELRKTSIPREEVTLSFARSSGPGGQVRVMTTPQTESLT